jgi:predicted ATP-grasp superfamily ATP-dependent carboligase
LRKQNCPVLQESLYYSAIDSSARPGEPGGIAELSIDLVIAGASVRSAAFSALRAGLQPACVDLFADADLRAVCPVSLVESDSYPDGIIAHCANLPTVPWLYTGALENRPNVIEAVSTQRPLWGCSPQAVKRVRSPLLLRDTLADNGIPTLQIRLAGETLPATARWLFKPLASAAGFGIRDGLGEVPAGHYGQEYVDGLSCSGLFIGHDQGALFLGATAQLVGISWLHAAAFHYAGNVGPLEIAPATTEHFAKLGNVLATHLGLRGIFGVDCVLSDGVPWVVEVNPRYTASVEVWEHARQQAVLALHRQAFEKPGVAVAFGSKRSNAATSVVAKGIYFAKEALTIPRERPWREPVPGTVVGFDMPSFADLPDVGARIEKGNPVLTMLVRGGSVEACLAELETRARDLDHWL